MACSNQSSTVTIPAIGSALIVPVDSVTCQPLDATKVIAGIPGSALGPSSSPGFSTDAAGIHLFANGAPIGSTYQITFTYAGKNWTMTALIDHVITPVGTTTTP